MKKIATLFLFLGMLNNAFSQADTLSENKKPWYVIDFVKTQFAGNIGFVSIGVGYKFLNNHLDTELLYGYVPKSISQAEQIHTITVKNTFSFLKQEFKGFDLSPIIGFGTSVETGNNSFLILPEQYPDGYYRTNAIHFTFYGGLKLHKEFKNLGILKAIDFYTELGAVDSFLWYSVISSEVKTYETFSTALGINFYFN